MAGQYAKIPYITGGCKRSDCSCVHYWSIVVLSPFVDTPMQQQKSIPQEKFDSETLGATALTAFFNIAAAWQLSADDERILLGAPPRSTFFKWKSERQAKLSADTLERISYVMGIYKALHILLPTGESADAWIKKPNSATITNGTSALERMRGGRVMDLADVRRYLDAQRG
jgi:hypothetical protein